MTDTSETQPNYQGPGLYRHYKGGEYEVLGLGRSEFMGLPLDSSGEPIFDVVYRSVAGDHQAQFDFWLRPLTDFNEQVRIRGEHPVDQDRFVPRFEKIAEAAPEIGVRFLAGRTYRVFGSDVDLSNVPIGSETCPHGNQGKPCLQCFPQLVEDRPMFQAPELDPDLRAGRYPRSRANEKVEMRCVEGCVVRLDTDELDSGDFTCVRHGFLLRAQTGFIKYKEGDVITFRNFEHGLQGRMRITRVDPETGAMDVEPAEDK